MDDYLSHDYKGSLERSVRRYFDEVLEKMESILHHNKKYFIYKSIILNNLYGVDIMKEAVETAKLRLFLKLVSTAEPNYRTDNLGIEPLPDIDFNIKAGNALIGFANEDEVENSLHKNIILAPHRITETKDAMYQLSKAVSRYKQLQLGEGDYLADDFTAAKADLTARQAKLRKNLDSLLRGLDYSAVSDEDWDTNYQPFHWVSEFYSIIVENGGFDVVIGNPPYVERKNVSYTIKGYETLSCGNLYAYVMERTKSLCAKSAYTSMIVPLSGHSTERMESLVKSFYNKFSMKYIFNISADAHPSMIFQGVKFRLAIFIVSNTNGSFYTTKYQKWFADERAWLFDRIAYTSHHNNLRFGVIGKLPSEIVSSIFSKLATDKMFFYQEKINDRHIAYYHNTPVHWIRSHSFIPYFKSERDGEGISTQLKRIPFLSEKLMKAGSAILNSSTFFIWWLAYSDCYHLNKKEIINFRFSDMSDVMLDAISEISDELSKDMVKKSERRIYNYATSGRVEYDEFYLKLSKPIINQIDTLLAKHYGFTEEELDYIINYDIKYRMGLGGSLEGGE